MKNLEDYKWICPEPFTNINITTAGRFRPCCLMQSNGETSPHFKDKIYNINQHTYEEFYNSELMTKLRNSMRDDTDQEFVSEVCRVCKIQENSGDRSRRQYYLQRFNEEFLHKKPELENIIHNQTKPTFFHSIEADGMGGNYCNLSCSMCHEYSSSGVLKEKLELNEPVTIPIKVANGKQSPLIKVTPCDAFLKELPQLLDNVLELKLVGGEPLLNKESYELMRMVNKPSETNLRIITNGTIDPSKFIQLAKQFKSVVVNISIEGVGQVNDYIRYPSDWNTILQTYLKLRKETNFSVCFVTTINALNINRLPEISLKFPKKTYYFASYVDNNCYTLSSIPPDLKELFLKQLTANKHLDQVDILISYLQSAVYKETDMIQMIQHIKRRDKLRGTNLLDVFPEWKEYYERY